MYDPNPQSAVRDRRRGGAAVVVVAALWAAVGLGVTSHGPSARAIGPTVVLTQVADLPNAVVLATRPATGAMYVGARNGRVYMLRPGRAPLLALDMRSYTRATGERGLLGLAFHPTLDFVYVSHTSIAGNSRLAEYAVRTDGTFRRSSRRLVLTKTQPYSNHKGGNVAFGPDGYLYLGFGDGGGGGDPRRYALKLNTWLGKIIRINPRPARGRSYQIPADNPYVSTNGAKKEIWSIGLRNPWRWWFDSVTGDLWIADVGQGSIEEIDLARSADGRGKGVSFGWSAYEGTERYNTNQPSTGHQGPLYEYSHAGGNCSITGGVVYRGSAIPSLVGAYLFADYCVGEIFALTLDGGNPVVTSIASVDNPVSFGVDAVGEAYVIELGGSVLRFDPAP